MFNARMDLCILAVMFMSLTAATSLRAAGSARIALISDTHTTRGKNEDQPLYKGRLDQVIEAVNAARRAVKLAQAAGQKELTTQIQARLQLYQANKPYRDDKPYRD